MKTEFKIIFGDSVLGNWYIKLITSEKKSVEQIKSLINNYTTEYSPCDIMDDLCENHPGWRWEDWDTQEDLYVPAWEWMS